MNPLGRISKMQREQRAQVQRQINVDWYSFVARPTCPPSTSIYIQGGTCIEAKSYFGMDHISRYPDLAWTVPNLVRDLVDPGDATVDMGFWAISTTDWSYAELTWTLSGSYRGGVLLLVLPTVQEKPTEANWLVRLLCFTEEYAIPSDAEAKLIEWLGEYSNVSASYDVSGHYWPNPAVYIGSPTTYAYQKTGMPLCGIVLRNDGTLGTGRHFLPVDATSRGRSYTWPRDLRPQWIHL